MCLKAMLQNQIKENKVTAFGNEEKNTAAVSGEASVLLSVLLPVLPTPRFISAQKTASVTSKKITKCL